MVPSQEPSQTPSITNMPSLISDAPSMVPSITASVSVVPSDEPSQQPSTCVDDTWHPQFGATVILTVDCSYFVQDTCVTIGDPEYNGLKASEACCICGGGV